MKLSSMARVLCLVVGGSAGCFSPSPEDHYWLYAAVMMMGAMMDSTAAVMMMAGVLPDRRAKALMCCR